ncbi:MAG: two-component system sensor histidine kinase NtrB [Desulfobulbus sp.]|jgi:two-component system sensor histidine kinase HydH
MNRRRVAGAKRPKSGPVRRVLAELLRRAILIGVALVGLFRNRDWRGWTGRLRRAVPRIPHPRIPESVRRHLPFRNDPDALLPFELVKFFSFTSLFLILLASFMLSWMIAANAKTVLLARSEAYARLFADNVNRQVFLQFVLPTVVRYGRIALSEPEQYQRLDRIIHNITQGMRIDSVTIYDPLENRIAYSTDAELMGERDMGGLEYQKAALGEGTSALISGGNLLSLLPGTTDVYCSLKTYVPFRQEGRLGERTGEIIGVIEVTQDLSEDLEATIRLQGQVIVMSLVVMSILFTVLSMIVVRANRIMAERAEERLRLEEQLNEAQRLATLGKMVAAVSHEIKNPLGIVRSTAEILGKRVSKTAPENERLTDIIIQETSRLDGIVREFLDFARPKEVRLVMADLHELIGRLARFMEPELVQKGVRFETRLDPELPNFFFDAEQIYQVLFNMVYNAIQAMPEGGDVRVSTFWEEETDTVVVEIADTGVGILPEKIDQVFSPFYTDKNRGTGLGLAIAKSIIETHQGRIGVVSTPGQGSAFHFSLSVRRDLETG